MRETIYYDEMLGWIHNLSPVLWEIGGLQIRYYGVIFALSLLAAFYCWQWQMRRGGYASQAIDAFIIYGAAGTIIGARLGHCLFYEWENYRHAPLTILYFWEGGLASHGATIGILLALLFYSLRYRFSYWEMTDRFTFAAAIAAAGVRIGNFINAEVVGRIIHNATANSGGVRFIRHDLADVPLALRLPADAPLRYPTQLYEFGLGLLVWIILYVADRVAGGEKRPRGMLLGLFFGLYFTGRFGLEYYKEYQTALRFAQGLTMGQYLSIIPAVAGWLLFISVIIFRWRKNSARTINE